MKGSSNRETRINRVKEVLVNKNMSQKELARLLGVTGTTMVNICNNITQPHLKDLVRIAELLNVNVKDLLYDTPVEDGAARPTENTTSSREEKRIKALYKDIGDYKKSMRFVNRPSDEVSVCISDPGGKIISVNDEFTNQTGYTIGDVKGKKPGPILQRENTNQEGILKIREAIKNRKYFEGEIVNYSKSGEEIICRLTLTPILDKNGNLEKFISLAVFLR